MTFEIPTISPPKPCPKLCQICFLQGIKYTCPTCLLKYCSLKCFKSTLHSDCLEESFYKSQVEAFLKEKVVSDEERKEMMKVLKRMREEDEEFDIAKLSLDDHNSDIGLSEKEVCEQFDKLVGSGQFGVLIDLWVPWWSISSPNPVPEIKSIPEIRIPPPHPDLYYTLIDFVFAYVVSIRTLNGEEDRDELVTITMSLSQVLSLTPTAFTYTSVHEVIELSGHKFLASEMKFNQESLPVFLNDVLEILSRKEWVLVVLSELTRWVSRKAVVRKLEYFMVLVNEMDIKILDILQVGVKQESLVFLGNSNVPVPESLKQNGGDLGRKPLIEEI